ncbi:DUF4870 domain-containing protein [Antribacter sp. KLBMP9083]|uniref:DUF4870 domain-containing protein n=1 Tax=Antribacter soli TaxID=2910976 RepID=A0AA41QJA6_9MICO|nr:DUF4870 domain-containing protein [Antribacter soli]MCF4123159.1 DUF4870 domain-containing protein [Antribacter soli]
MSEPTPGGIPQQPLSESEAKQWAGLSHLLGGILGVLAPLIIWLVYKDRNNAYLNTEAKKSLNFQILVTIAYIVLTVTVIFSWAVFVPWALGLVYGIINFQAVNNGQPTKYLWDVAIVK